MPMKLRAHSSFLALLIGSGCHEDVYVLTVEDAEAYADARCEAATRCCPSSVEQDCESTRAHALLHYQDLTDSPLSFSGQCMRDVLSWTRQSGGIDCVESSELGDPGCQLAHGERARGEPCIDFGDLGFYATDCA